MRNNKVRIAIVDSGIDKLENYEGASIVWDELSEQYTIAADFCDRLGHGTMILNIIESKEIDCEIFVLKLFDDDDEIDTEKLIFGLEFLNNNIHPDIVHLSLGISFCDDIKRLKNICSLLADAGAIIVSAFDNNGALSYPAALPCVIGVEHNPMCRKTTEYFFLKNSPINISAIGITQRLEGLDGHFEDVIGSSFAAPHITSLIADKLVKKEIGNNYMDALNMLKENASKIYDAGDLEPLECPFNINEAVIFPYNKEIDTLLRHPKLLSFDVSGIYDLKFLKNIGNKIKLTPSNEITISSVEKIDWNGSFDTVILGHLHELSDIANKNYAADIIKKCIRYGKNIYSFDGFSGQVLIDLQKADIKYFSPIINPKNVPVCFEGKMRQIGKPILCVAGTSPKQGKFSLQLTLKTIMSDHVKVGHLSTEPSGYLLGADYVFPMGYNANIEVTQANDFISVANYTLGQIEDLDYDIILMGLQSQTIPMQVCNQKDMVLYNHYLLLATNPDAVVLTVNLFDEFEYIEKTIKYLESIIICDVIAIVIFPMQRLFKWNTIGNLASREKEDVLRKMQKTLQGRFGKPVFVLDSHEDMLALSQICLNNFICQEVEIK